MYVDSVYCRHCYRHDERWQAELCLQHATSPDKRPPTNGTVAQTLVDCVWNVMAHAQKPDFFFQRNGRVHLKSSGGRQFIRLLAAEVCASAVVVLDTTCSEVVLRVLATHYIHQFPLHFPSPASPCAITFQLDSNKLNSDRCPEQFTMCCMSGSCLYFHPSITCIVY